VKGWLLRFQDGPYEGQTTQWPLDAMPPDRLAVLPGMMGMQDADVVEAERKDALEVCDIYTRDPERTSKLTDEQAAEMEFLARGAEYHLAE
jgi:hypothetical protein